METLKQLHAHHLQHGAYGQIQTSHLMEFLDGFLLQKYKLDMDQITIHNYHQPAEFYNSIQTETAVSFKNLLLKLENIF